jgi:hypothetical protein
MNLFVANLNYDLTEKELEQVFAPYGDATVKIIKDPKNGRSKGYGFINGLDAAAGRLAIKEMNGRMIMGREMVVKQDEKGAAPVKRPGQGNKGPGKRGPGSGGPKDQKGQKPMPAGQPTFPYRFTPRTVPTRQQQPFDDCLKEAPDAFHHQLDAGRCDIAFEIEWETLTPTALNPCAAPDVPKTMPKNENKEWSGYDRRWLMIDNRLAISPFTVKSAIAAGFANLLGGCYRVIDKMEGHPAGGVLEGQYQYKGGYKRYRVSMSNRSRPGVIRKIETKPDGSRTVEIQPVTEYYLDQNTVSKLEKNKTYFALIRKEKYKQFVTSFRDVEGPKKPEEKRLVYHGPYRFGMNLTLVAPALNKKHYHRFFETKGGILSGTIKAENFDPPINLEKKVYMGKFENKHFKNKGPDPRKHLIGEYWYEDLNSLGVGDWVYYHSFYDPRKEKEVIANIGKNFQFKALFYHPDAVPPDHRPCGRVDMLCPRCRMFGMVETEKAKDRRAVGFKGRFKSSTLRDGEALAEIEPKPYAPPEANASVELRQWGDPSGTAAAYQALLPISGPPKPNKRDDGGGYFDDRTGEIRGAKIYRHAGLKSAEDIQQVDSNPEKDYTHRLRNYAMVCKPGRKFAGTVGAENCDPREAAALTLLLSSEMSGHGFKIGMGKAFGMGSVKSRIRSVWVRKVNDYDKWEKIEGVGDMAEKDFIRRLDGAIIGVGKEIGALRAIDDFKQRMNPFDQMESTKLGYPKPQAKRNQGRKYWDIAKAAM